MKKNIISLAFLLLPCSLWADDFTVNSAEDWQTVCSNAEAYASGTITFGADFEVTTAFPAAFTGTLDGQGHTITYNLTNPGKFGLFSSTGEGAVIKNLKIAGTIEANTGAAGVVYTVNGATTIQMSRSVPPSTLIPTPWAASSLRARISLPSKVANSMARFGAILLLLPTVQALSAV